MNPSQQAVSQALQSVLLETYTLFLITHNYHWNVEGPHFVALHQLFETHYTELFTAIDDIAERIRTLGAYAHSYDSEHFLSPREDLIKCDTDGQTTGQQMIQHLIELHQKVIDACQQAKEVAARSDDNESEDMMIARISTHQKSLWMLTSLLK